MLIEFFDRFGLLGCYQYMCVCNGISIKISHSHKGYFYFNRSAVGYKNIEVIPEDIYSMAVRIFSDPFIEIEYLKFRQVKNDGRTNLIRIPE